MNKVSQRNGSHKTLLDFLLSLKTIIHILTYLPSLFTHPLTTPHSNRHARYVFIENFTGNDCGIKTLSAMMMVPTTDSKAEMSSLKRCEPNNILYSAPIYSICRKVQEKKKKMMMNQSGCNAPINTEKKKKKKWRLSVVSLET